MAERRDREHAVRCLEGMLGNADPEKVQEYIAGKFKQDRPHQVDNDISIEQLQALLGQRK